MNIGEVNFNVNISEEDLKEALEYWLESVHSTEVEVTHIKHLVGERTEGCGGMEIDIPYQEGLELTCENRVRGVL